MREEEKGCGRGEGGGRIRKQCCDNGDQIVNDNANASSAIILLNRFVIPLPAGNNIYPTVRFLVIKPALIFIGFHLLMEYDFYQIFLALHFH